MRKRQAERLIVMSLVVLTFALYRGAKVMYQQVQVNFLQDMQTILLLVSIILLILLMLDFLLSNQIHKGFRYFWCYWMTTTRLEKQLVDAGFGIQRSYYVDLPEIQLSFNSDYNAGVLKIRNSVRFDKKLDEVVLSAALGRFVVERHYLEDDRNTYVYELVDGATSFKMVFSDYNEFLKYNATIAPYQLFWIKDQRLSCNIPLS